MSRWWWRPHLLASEFSACDPLCSIASSIVIEKTFFWMNPQLIVMSHSLILVWHHPVSSFNSPTPYSQRIWQLGLACRLSCIGRLWRVQTLDISSYLLHTIRSGQPRLKYKVRRGPACAGRRSSALYSTAEILMFDRKEHSGSRYQRCKTSNFGKFQIPAISGCPSKSARMIPWASASALQGGPEFASPERCTHESLTSTNCPRNFEAVFCKSCDLASRNCSWT